MQNVIYAGLRNPGRDQSIYEAILSRPVNEVAEELKCSPSTVRAAAKRIADLQAFQLTLTGGVKAFLSALSPLSHSSVPLSAPIGISAGRSKIWSCRIGRSRMARTGSALPICASWIAGRHR